MTDSRIYLETASITANFIRLNKNCMSVGTTGMRDQITLSLIFFSLEWFLWPRYPVIIPLLSLCDYNDDRIGAPAFYRHHG